MGHFTRKFMDIDIIEGAITLTIKHYKAHFDP